MMICERTTETALRRYPSSSHLMMSMFCFDAAVSIYWNPCSLNILWNYCSASPSDNIIFMQNMSSTSRLEEYQTAFHLKGISDILQDERQITDVLHKDNVVRRGCTAVIPQKIIVCFSFASMVNHK
jgi:hypothetical protein